MNKSYIISHFLLILSVFVLNACKGEVSKEVKNEKDKVTVKEKTNISIEIINHFKNIPLVMYEPIENNTNFIYYSSKNKIQIKEDTLINFKFELTENNTYVFQYGIARAILNIFPSDSINIKIICSEKGYDMKFSGSDSIFHQKYNEDAYKMFMDKSFGNVIPQKPDLPSIMIGKIKAYISLKTSFIDTLNKTNKLTEEKYMYFKKAYEYSIASICGMPISNYYDGKKETYKTWFDELYNTYPPLNKTAQKTFYGSIYISHFLYDLKENRTKAYEGVFDSTWSQFKTYNHFGYAPKELQIPLWGNMLMILVKNNAGEINVNKAFELYKRNFPKSPYNILIEEMLPKKKEIFKGKFIADNPITLYDLWQASFKGRPLFIDLWATWCAPCTAEFEYKNELEKYLSSVKVEMLYLSMDEIKDKKKWENLVKNYKLNGYNHIVSEALKKDILKIIYKSNDFSIPRYLLLDKNGNVIIAEANLPSSGQVLYDEIDAALR